MSDDGFGVRPAIAADAEALAALERGARAALVDARGGARLLDEQPAVGDWTAHLDRQDVAVAVAEIDGVVVGYLDLRHGDPAWVHQVYVEPEARELGFGDDMIAWAIEAARDRGASAIESFALPGDRETKNLFERAGITARKLIVAKRL